MDRVFLFVCRELRSYTGYGKSLCYALLLLVLDNILGREQGTSVDYFLCLYSYCLDDGATRSMYFRRVCWCTNGLLHPTDARTHCIFSLAIG